MKVLIVNSGNQGQISPFISEQAESLKKLGVEIEHFSIHGKGIAGYLKNIKPLKQKIKSFAPDIVHSHYGLSGLLAVLSKNKNPLIITFHGNDINPIHPRTRFMPNLNQLLSRIVYLFSDYSIFVTRELSKKIGANSNKSSIIPCQVNLETFYPVDKLSARQELKLPPNRILVLFSSSFNNPIKNFQLAKKACDQFENLELLELKGFSRAQVNLLLNACDLALLTSYNEGSTQFIKEAMACNCPVVSTMVGDSGFIFGDTAGCYLTTHNVEDVISNIQNAIDFSQSRGRTKGRDRITELGLDSETISRKIYEVYKNVIKKCAGSAV